VRDACTCKKGHAEPLGTAPINAQTDPIFRCSRQAGLPCRLTVCGPPKVVTMKSD
jgi:hypothetical protein